MEKELSLRDMIAERQNELLSKKIELHPMRAAEILKELSALYGNTLDEVKNRQMAYNRVLKSIFDEEPKANRAKLKAEISDEFEALLEARGTKELTLEMMRSLKYFLREKEQEYRETNN